MVVGNYSVAFQKHQTHRPFFPLLQCQNFSLSKTGGFTDLKNQSQDSCACFEEVERKFNAYCHSKVSQKA